MTRRALLLALLGSPFAGTAAAQPFPVPVPVPVGPPPRHGRRHRRRCRMEPRRVAYRDQWGRIRHRTVQVQVCR